MLTSPSNALHEISLLHEIFVLNSSSHALQGIITSSLLMRCRARKLLAPGHMAMNNKCQILSQGWEKYISDVGLLRFSRDFKSHSY